MDATKQETMREEILKILPEINSIKDAELREQTAQVWEDAIADGGWTIEQILRMPFTVHVENCNITFIEHVRTVCKMCVAVSDVLKDAYGDRTQIDYDTLIAGAKQKIYVYSNRLIRYASKRKCPAKKGVHRQIIKQAAWRNAAYY